MNNEESEMRAGDLWVVNREVIHCIEEPSDDFLFIQLHINTEKFNHYIPDIWTVYFKCGPQNNDLASVDLKKEIRSRVCTIVKIMDARQLHIQEDNRIIYACIDILNDLKLGFNLMGKKGSDAVGDEKFDRIWRIIDYIFDNCNRKLTLKEVAKQEHITESYLSRILKNETGTNFKDTVAHIRSECSIRYLLETKMSITDIAYECGFSAPRYYNAAFKKFFHCTPLDYRKKLKKTITYSSEIKTNSVVYQEHVNKDMVFQLMDTYSLSTNLSWEAVRLSVDMDTIGTVRRNRKNSYRRGTVKCVIEDLLNYQNEKLLKSCKEQLGISNVSIVNCMNRELISIAENNIRYIGMSIVKSSENDINFNELFTDQHVATDVFYKQQILNNIPDKYVALGENTLLYILEDTLNIVLINDKSTKEKRFILEFRGIKARQRYMLKKQAVGSKFVGTMTAFTDGKARNSIIEREVFRPELTIDIIENLKLQPIEELVRAKHVELITLIPLEK